MEENKTLLLELHRLFVSIDKTATRHINQMGLSQSEFIVLVHLTNNESATVQKLAEIAMVTSGTITNTIKKLIDKELIYKIPDKEDKRVFNVFITSYGRSSFKKFVAKHQKYVDLLFEDISLSKKTDFISMVRFFSSELEGKMSI